MALRQIKVIASQHDNVYTEQPSGGPVSQVSQAKIKTYAMNNRLSIAALFATAVLALVLPVSNAVAPPPAPGNQALTTPEVEPVLELVDQLD